MFITPTKREGKLGEENVKMVISQMLLLITWLTPKSRLRILNRYSEIKWGHIGNQSIEETCFIIIPYVGGMKSKLS